MIFINQYKTCDTLYCLFFKRHVASVLKFHLELALAASREDELNPCWLFQGDPYAVNKLFFIFVFCKATAIFNF